MRRTQMDINWESVSNHLITCVSDNIIDLNLFSKLYKQDIRIMYYLLSNISL